jgi:hypothetical protein
MKTLMITVLLSLFTMQAHAKIVTRISKDEAQRIASVSRELRLAVAPLSNPHIVSISHEERTSDNNVAQYNHEVSFSYRHDQGDCIVSVGLGLFVRSNPGPRISYSVPYVKYAFSSCNQ